ncbi:Uncharacterized protein TCM_045449 [Theobroma cacao]|uniref:Nuclear transport factor 2 family protein with RNA binding domain n=1 Tax=Theobroma cacao TaxID=3641 RepID=A0A061FSX0_THECC|nr:Uncharacterized protein TCM_045449 [Theobroma cacao]
MVTAVEADAFVKQYYCLPRDNQSLIDRYYNDSSSVKWSGEDGVMRDVTTMEGIYDHFLSSLDAQEYLIQSCDVQDSLAGGLLVVVTGCVTLKNDETKMFTQSFFLAPQEESFFVLNDVFRFFSDEEAVKDHADETSEPEAVKDHADETSEPEAVKDHADETSDPEAVKDHADETSDPLPTNLEPVPVQEIPSVPSEESKQKANSEKFSPQDLAEGFLDKYYDILLISPNLVHRFYKDSSKVSWESRDGVMSDVTVMESMYEHFSPRLDAKECDLLSSNVQGSCDTGISIQVVGRMTMNDDEIRHFSQSFFLAPQEKGYFVSNDVFRFLKDEEITKIDADETSDPLRTNFEPSPDQEMTMVSSLDPKQEPNTNNPAIPVTETSSSAVQNNALEETSIYVGNLRMRAKVEELEEAFKRFGIIKPDGVRIVNNDRIKKCYGFIEFESPISAQNAIQASSIKIGKKRVTIETINKTSDDEFHQGRMDSCQ